MGRLGICECHLVGDNAHYVHVSQSIAHKFTVFLAHQLSMDQQLEGSNIVGRARYFAISQG